MSNKKPGLTAEERQRLDQVLHTLRSSLLGIHVMTVERFAKNHPLIRASEQAVLGLERLTHELACLEHRNP